MAEVLLGLVFAGIPIAITVIGLYQEPVRNHRHYRDLLEDFKLQLDIQQKHLTRSFQNLGLNTLEQAPIEVEAHLRSQYPAEYEMMMRILQQIGKLISQLMGQLEVDLQGKPTLGTDRTAWEWRRIKRSLDSKQRKEVIDKLQFYNDEFKRCFEDREPVLEDFNPGVEKLKTKFDPIKCNSVREQVRAVHGALTSAWQCPHPHRANIHMDSDIAVVDSPGFKIALSFHQQLPQRDFTDSTFWRETVFSFETGEEAVQTALPVPLSDTERPSAPVNATSRKHSHGSSFRKLFGLSRSASSNKPSPFVHSPPSSNSKDKRKQDQHKVTAVVVEQSSSKIKLEPTPTNIVCLCEAVQRHGHSHGCLGMLADPDPDRHRLLRITSESHDITDQIKTIPLSSLFPNQRARPPVRLSKKQRLSIAATMTWTVLHLCGSPWLSESCERQDIYLFLKSRSQQLRAHDAYISCNFLPKNHEVSTDPVSTPESTIDVKFASRGIRNKALYALGILLIELWKDRPFEFLRKESEMLEGQVDTTLDDHELADRLLDEIYNDAGSSYGGAVQKCLRCEFSVRDVMKSFDFSEFRVLFYEGVIAPIQYIYINTLE